MRAPPDLNPLAKQNYLFVYACLCDASNTQLGDAKAQNEDMVRRCADGMVSRAEKLMQALKLANRKQVLTFECFNCHVLRTQCTRCRELSVRERQSENP